jgi:hypothetical protein
LGDFLLSRVFGMSAPFRLSTTYLISSETKRKPARPWGPTYLQPSLRCLLYICWAASVRVSVKR